MLEGDHDVFGDGSVMIIGTPGHTPGRRRGAKFRPRHSADIDGTRLGNQARDGTSHL